LTGHATAIVAMVLPACRTDDAFRVTSSWTESRITWNNQPFGTTLNNPASGQRTDAITVGSTPCQNTTNSSYVTGWSVAADVQAFIGGSATNNGWMFRDDVEGGSPTRRSSIESSSVKPSGTEGSGSEGSHTEAGQPATPATETHNSEDILGINVESISDSQ